MEIKSDLSIIVFIALIASVGSRVPIKTFPSQADLGNKYGSDSSRSKGSHTSSSSSEEDTAGGRTYRHISGGSRFSSSGNSPQHTDEGVFMSRHLVDQVFVISLLFCQHGDFLPPSR